MERKALHRSSSLATSMTTSIVIAHKVTAIMEHQIIINLEINISQKGIHPFGMTTQLVNDKFAASNKTVQRGDRLGEVFARALSIGKEVLICPWDVWIGNARQHQKGLVYHARKERMMEEVEEELQSLSVHQHYTSSGVRSIPLQGGSAGPNPAPTIPDHQLMEEEEDGASMHQPSSTAAAPSRSMALPLALLALLSATSMEA